jgi:signal transduction histidine kinase
MINGFLDVSRFEAGGLTISKTAMSLKELLIEVVEETRLVANTHTIELLCEDSLIVEADHDKISSVISNLISNAIKYSPRGTAIKVSGTIRDGSAVVSVQDRGAGIRPDDAKKIFERYYRAEDKSTRHVAGFGIGLYLCAEIMQKHDGKLWFDSEAGKGSTFYFSLPAIR